MWPSSCCNSGPNPPQRQLQWPTAVQTAPPARWGEQGHWRPGNQHQASERPLVDVGLVTFLNVHQYITIMCFKMQFAIILTRWKAGIRITSSPVKWRVPSWKTFPSTSFFRALKSSDKSSMCSSWRIRPGRWNSGRSPMRAHSCFQDTVKADADLGFQLIYWGG